MLVHFLLLSREERRTRPIFGDFVLRWASGMIGLGAGRRGAAGKASRQAEMFVGPQKEV